VTIVEKTDDPFDGEIRFKLESGKPGSFPLYFRIPAWAEGATLVVDGQNTPCRAGALARIERIWRAGDECVLSLPMRVRTEARFNGAIGYPANAADPPVSPVATKGPLIDLELIPYGCARLRISEFPWFND
jgi:hypothetical protein